MEQNKKAGEVHHIISTVSGKRPGNYKVAELIAKAKSHTQ
jgi:hypothetical protein